MNKATKKLIEKFDEVVAFLGEIENNLLLVMNQFSGGKIDQDLYEETMVFSRRFNAKVITLCKMAETVRDEDANEIISYIRKIAEIEMPEVEVLEYSEDVLKMTLLKIQTDAERARELIKFYTEGGSNVPKVQCQDRGRSQS